MTRDEAIAIELKQIEAWEPFSAIPPEIRHQAGAAQIDSYVALGMLKLDDPESAYKRAYDLLDEGGYHSSQILELLTANGLKIVSRA